MSRHCKYSSTAKTRAIFADLLLAFREYHELCNHEASESNYRACLSGAGDEAMQNLCIPNLPMSKCYNSTAPNWYQTFPE
jgi:hypothetical protein